MNKLFPTMRECPEGKQIAMGAAYWIVYKIVLPFLVILICAGVMTNTSSVSIACTGYSLINCICVGYIFRDYLKDSLWVIRLDKKRFFFCVLQGLLVFSAIEIPLFLMGKNAGDLPLYFPLPITEPMFDVLSVSWVAASPVLAGLCLIFPVPLTISCLYYTVGFAVPCRNRPWLGYLIVALIALIPAVLMVTSIGSDISRAAAFYFAMLPSHFCSCWVYQRSDTIWAPVLFQAVVNIISIPLLYTSGTIVFI